MESVEEICDDIALINNSRKVLDGKVHDIKQQYKDNTYEIEFNGTFNKMAASLTAEYEIVKIEPRNGNQNLTIKLVNDLTTNELIQRMMAFGNIVSFRESVPKMNDIFIRVVNEAKAAEKAE
jgi:ABC-2 type transport system ATP-binding protein